MMVRRPIAALLALILLIVLIPSAQAATPPADFSDTLVADVSGPTGLAFTPAPDERLLITTQPGQLRVYANGALLATAALDLSGKMCDNFERGLLGVAVDPNFASNRFIYLYYTFNKFNACPEGSQSDPKNPVNRVSRFVFNTTTNTADAATELVLVDNIPSPNGNHNAGDLKFGKDGFLYISIGDGGCSTNINTLCGNTGNPAHATNVLLGKILRITGDGGIPAGNPFLGADSARCNVAGSTDAGKKCQEIFAMGLRNPFRIAFDPNDAGTRFFINDVGQNTWEEVDLGQAGADYGWNTREGPCANGSTTNCGTVAGLTNPIYSYKHGAPDNCDAITGGAFVPNGVWPAAYDGAYLFGDYTCSRLFALLPAGNTYTRANFATNAGGVTTLIFGPYQTTQALYYATYGGGGEVRRIVYTGSLNRAPTALLDAQPRYGDTPLTVTFDGSASSDPDSSAALTYLWDFGDQTATTETSSPTIDHTYTITGTYTATLRVRDGDGALSTAATLRIDVGNAPPAPVISAPAVSDRFRVGQTITLQGSATDPQDGALPASALSWRVLLHHNEHTHPYLQSTAGTGITITAPAPEDLSATSGSYLEIELTAIDALGLTEVVTQALQPNRVTVTFATIPSGRQLTVNELTFTASRALVSWEGFGLKVGGPAQQDTPGNWLRLASWSDGGAPSHTITTPAAAATYTATFGPAKVSLLPVIRGGPTLVR